MRERVPVLLAYNAVFAGVWDLFTRDDEHPFDKLLLDHLVETIATHVGTALVEQVLSDASDEGLFIMTEGCAIEASDVLDDSGGEECVVVTDERILLGSDMHLKFPITHGLVDRE